MTDERSYPAGVTCWVDTEQPDVDAARDFYASPFRLDVLRRSTCRRSWHVSDRFPGWRRPGRDRPAAGRCTGGVEHLHRGRRRGCGGGRRAGGRWQRHARAGRRGNGRTVGGPCRSAGCTLPPVAAAPTTGRPAHQRARQRRAEHARPLATVVGGDLGRAGGDQLAGERRLQVTARTERVLTRAGQARRRGRCRRRGSGPGVDQLSMCLRPNGVHAFGTVDREM